MKGNAFSPVIQTAAIKPLLTELSNLTILVPSHHVIDNMDQDEKAFWMSKSNVLGLIK